MTIGEMSVTRHKLLLALGLSLLAALALATSASAQEGPTVTDDEVNEVASHLYCPICENVPLDVCPTQACSDWRAEIRSLLERGATEEEVREYFVDRYGVRVLGEPPRKGFTSLVWILPLVGVGVGTLVLGRSLLQMRQAAQPGEPTSPQQSPPAQVEAHDEDAAYVARLERELKDYAI